MQTDSSKPLRVSDLERVTGINRSTIHYYLREGLLSEPIRTSKTMAYYSSKHLEEIEKVRDLQEQGYPIAFIKTKMDELRDNKESGAQRVEDPEERRESIIEKAAEVFSKKGYHDAKMSDIAEAVGVGQSTLYLYFPNKQALFVECIDKVLDSMIEDFNVHLKDIDDVLEKAMKTGDLVMHSYPQFIEILHVLDNIAGEDPNMAAKRKEVINTITSIMKDQLEEAIEKGAIPDGDVTIASHILIGMTEGLLRLSSIDDHYNVDVIMKEVENFLSDTKTFEASIKIMSSMLSKMEWGAETRNII